MQEVSTKDHQSSRFASKKSADWPQLS